jgi:predicted nucleic acid-binding protein
VWYFHGRLRSSTGSADPIELRARTSLGLAQPARPEPPYTAPLTAASAPVSLVGLRQSLVSLSGYDGSAGTLVDTNVWIVCIDEASAWHEWAVEQLQVLSQQSPLRVNLIVYTELLVPGPDVAALDGLLDVYEVQRSALPWACAALAAAAFALYRRRGGAKQTPLSAFYIGAHAAVSNLSVLTRDPAPYKSYFPRLHLRAP